MWNCDYKVKIDDACHFDRMKNERREISLKRVKSQETREKVFR